MHRTRPVRAGDAGSREGGHVPPRLLSSPPPPPFATSGDLILPTLLSSAGQCQASSQTCSADLESLERFAGRRTSTVVIVAPSFSTLLSSRLYCELSSLRALVFLAVRSVLECEDAGGWPRAINAGPHAVIECAPGAAILPTSESGLSTG